MDRRLQRDKQLEGTAKPTGKAGPRPWDIKQYIYEEPKDDQRSSHDDPRLELTLQSYDRHQEQIDNDFPSSDADHGYGSPVFYRDFTPEFDASASTTSELGTLAGGAGYSKLKYPITEKTVWNAHVRQRNRSKAAAEASHGRHELSGQAKKRLWYSSKDWNIRWDKSLKKT